MILKLPENRKKIIDYLNCVDEDTFINEFVIPFFCSQGYQVYRLNSHGPGEHGKDIIFVRYIPIFFENEFISVQAKAEPVTTSNVEKFGSQLKRALKTKFAPHSGSGDLCSHYAVFINARKHSNDAYTEFPQLVNSPHGKILSQENVCELIMQFGIAPERLLGQLSMSTPEIQSKEDSVVVETILGNNPADLDSLLDHKLKLLRDKIDYTTKELVIDYVYERWESDRTWIGTVKPMKWFDTYFDFFSEKSSKYLLTIFDELLSSTPSFDAFSYTESVVKKITPELLAPIENDFINLCARRSVSYPKDKTEYLYKKLKEFVDSNLIKSTTNRSIAEKVLLIEKYRKEGKSEERKKLEEDLCYFLYPDENYRTKMISFLDE
jgi:hypothetical protein